MKLKWKVQPAPTGRYRSFDKRGWPQLLTPSDRVAAFIDCEDSYYPPWVREGRHKELSVIIYDHTNGMQQRKTRRLVARFANLDEAKKAAETFLAAHVDFLPKEQS